MKLVKAEILNFRSVKEVTVLFDPACRVLVGINESGKSNILKALSLLSEDHDPVCKDDLREILPEEDEIKDAHVKFFFRLDKSESEEVYEVISEKILASSKDPDIVLIDKKQTGLKSLCNLRSDVRYLVDIIKEEKGTSYTAFESTYKFNGNWKKPTKACPIEYEVTFKGQNFKLATYSLIRGDDFLDIPPEYLEEAKIEDLSSLIGSTCVSVAEGNFPDTLFWEYDESNLLPSQVLINDFATNPDTCAPLKNMFLLAGVTKIKEEIERVKLLSNNQIQNFLDRIASKTTGHFRSVWKEYKNIEFKLRLEADKIIPAIKEQNSFDFSKRSDGFKRFVTFLLMISVKVKTDDMNNTLLLIDEPDSGLHPSGARYLRDELIRISAKNYVVYSTHSIFMIDAGNIGRHYIVSKKEEITTIEEAKDSNLADEEVIFNALGCSVFEILSEKNIIFEGWKDKKLFLTAIDKASADIKKSFKDTGICHAKGVKHIKTITPMIELGRRQCVIISDSDAPAKEQQKRYKQDKGYGEWKIYQDIDSSINAITGEDFIKNNYITKQVNSVITSFGLPAFMEGDLATDSNKLESIESWLKKNGLTQQQVTDTINSTKDLIFDHLSNKDIEDSYELLIKGLRAML